LFAAAAVAICAACVLAGMPFPDPEDALEFGVPEKILAKRPSGDAIACGVGMLVEPLPVAPVLGGEGDCDGVFEVPVRVGEKLSGPFDESEADNGIESPMRMRAGVSADDEVPTKDEDVAAFVTAAVTKSAVRTIGINS
jgi:hypothetical protein